MDKQDNQSLKRLEATIYGRVQGVSFRYYTQREAQRLRLTGWVANQSDGSVRVIAEGPELPLHQLLQFLYRGSPMAQVDHVDLTWGAATNEFHYFRVRYL
ncbi:MAG: acylphosphatase [Anaerolineales bacterium]|nr:acylphosphatase [Anaerolineales bacterium]